MFKKKFEVRVRHFLREYYVVEYAHFRAIRIWKPLVYWFDTGHPCGLQKYSTDLFSNVEKAEEIARGLHSMADVDKYHKPEELLREKWYKEEAEWQEKNVPYGTKRIK